MTAARPRIGDRVHDPIAGRDAVLTNISADRYQLRPLYGLGGYWDAEDPDRLTVLVRREDRVDLSTHAPPQGINEGGDHAG